MEMKEAKKVERRGEGGLTAEAGSHGEEAGSQGDASAWINEALPQVNEPKCEMELVRVSVHPSVHPSTRHVHSTPPPTPNVLHQSPHSKFQLESRKKYHRSNQETQSALQCNANDDVTRQPFVVQTYRFISESGQVAMLNDSSIWFIYFLSLSSIFIV